MNWRWIIVLIVLIVGALITRNSMKSGWYKKENIRESDHQPPSYMFGIVWFVIYVIYAFSWEYLVNKHMPLWLDILFGINMILNLAWIWIFFGLGDVELSRYIIVLLLILTLFQAYSVWNFVETKKYQWTGVCTFGLLIYSSWLICATVLNFDFLKI
jgi:tryptophan-rich sensory protein